MRHVEIAVKIGLDGPVEMLVGQLLEAVDVLLEGGVVDEDVELAEFLDGLLDRVLAEFGVGDIAGEENAAAAFLLDSLLGLLGVLVLVEIGERDVGALAREEHRDRAADAGIAAGDQRHLVEKLLRALVVRGVVHRLEFELGLEARLAQMLVGERRVGIDARSGLHRAAAVFLRAFLLIGAVDLALNGALVFGSALSPLFRRTARMIFWRGLIWP